MPKPISGEDRMRHNRFSMETLPSGPTLMANIDSWSWDDDDDDDGGDDDDDGDEPVAQMFMHQSDMTTSNLEAPTWCGPPCWRVMRKRV